MLLAASTQRSIGLVIFAIVVIGFLVFLVLNILSAKPEAGSELELAPNRKPYLPDEELEGSKLDKSLGAGLFLLAVIGIGLPLYWLGEPGRQEGRIADTQRIFTDRGRELYEEGANCQACHGPDGVGGVVGKTITDEGGNFVSVVNWKAPALNTVLSRYSVDEVRHVMTFGRNNVMPAWGAAGGGPLTEQQLDNLIFYLRSIQIDEAQIRSEVDSSIEAAVAAKLDVDVGDPAVGDWLASVDEVVAGARSMAVDRDPGIAGDDDAIRRAGLELLSTGEAPDSELYWEYGELLFDNPAAGGAYGCARCHTYGWSFDGIVDGDDAIDGHPGPILDAYDTGGGFFGANLTGGTTLTQFETAAGHAEFVATGQTVGDTYGRGGSGDVGQMPGFGPRTDDDVDIVYPGLLTQDQVDAIVAFERNL